jgi:hypothetical protein
MFEAMIRLWQPKQPVTHRAEETCRQPTRLPDKKKTDEEPAQDATISLDVGDYA